MAELWVRDRATAALICAGGSDEALAGLARAAAPRSTSPAATRTPAFNVGGGWFDHADNPEGIWLSIGDAVGKGTRAAGLSAVALGALRSARRRGLSLEGVCAAIDDAVSDLGNDTFVTAVVAHWHARSRTRSTAATVAIADRPVAACSASLMPSTLKKLRSGRRPSTIPID